MDDHIQYSLIVSKSFGKVEIENNLELEKGHRKLTFSQEEGKSRVSSLS